MKKSSQHQPQRKHVGKGMHRALRAGVSGARALAVPLGKRAGKIPAELRDASRLEQGLTLILPGLNGESTLHESLAKGLADAGVDCAIDIYDWTTGHILLFWWYLCDWQRNLAQAGKIAGKIVDYQQQYPGRPVHLVGYSAGGPMALLALAALPPGHTVDRVILLGAAVSPEFNLAPALQAATGGIWNFQSPIDQFFLGLGTLVFGTLDRRHRVSAGAIGFKLPEGLTDVEQQLYATRLHSIVYEWKMAGSFHFGGHFGWTNRVFVSEWVAPVLLGEFETADGNHVGWTSVHPIPQQQ